MSGNDDHNNGDDGDDGEKKKKTADIIAWPGKRADADEDGLPHDEAEDLVMKALSSITGRDPAELRRELRAREAAEANSEERPSNVIDLDAVRASREAHHSVSGLDIGDLARAGFQAVMDELIQLQPHGGELIIDGDFMRAHGPTLIGNVLQQVGKALLARREASTEVETSDAMGEVAETDEGAADGSEPAAENSEPTQAANPEHTGPVKPVEIRFDFGNLAMSLLSRLGVFRGPAVVEPVPDVEPTQKPSVDPTPPGDETPTE